MRTWSEAKHNQAYTANLYCFGTEEILFDQLGSYSVPPSKLNRLGKPPRTMCNVRPFNQLVPRLPAGVGLSELAMIDTSKLCLWTTDPAASWASAPIPE